MYGVWMDHKDDGKGLMPTFRDQFTFQYGGRELECHYERALEVEKAEARTWDYPGSPAYSHACKIKLLYVETDEKIWMIEISKNYRVRCGLRKASYRYFKIPITDLPDALIDKLEDMAWTDANENLNIGEI